MVATKSYVGKSVAIKAGTKVRTQGGVTTQQRNTVVTVRSQESTRSGKVRVSWIRDGYAATTLIA